MICSLVPRDFNTVVLEEIRYEHRDTGTYARGPPCRWSDMMVAVVAADVACIAVELAGSGHV